MSLSLHRTTNPYPLLAQPEVKDRWFAIRVPVSPHSLPCSLLGANPFQHSTAQRLIHRALESILLSVLSALEAEMVFIRNLIGGLLAELEDDIDHDRFKRLLHYSRRLASFQNRAKLVRS